MSKVRFQAGKIIILATASKPAPAQPLLLWVSGGFSDVFKAAVVKLILISN
jgi:hypothetical protein